MESVTPALPVYEFPAVAMVPTKDGNVLGAKGENGVCHSPLPFLQEYS